MVTLHYHEDRMHDGSAPGWRQTIDRHQAALADDLSAQLTSELETGVALAVAAERTRVETEAAQVLSHVREEARLRAETAAAHAAEETRRRLSESLNQTLRRIRQTTAEHESLQLLLEDSAPWAERAVVLLIENNQATVAAWRGVSPDPEEDGAAIPLDAAAAIASCAESRDPVVSLAADGEISPELAAALGGEESGKVYLFPVTARLKTVAMLIAAGAVTPAPIELLCEAAGMKLESFEAPVSAVPSVPLVQIGGGPAPAGEPAAWSKLTPEEQALHLRAQRTARVRVAQMRISEFEALRTGAQAGNIYGALRDSIDRAREEYQRTFSSQSPDMVDYLHLELVRSLAHDDSRLLGRDYPGPVAPRGN